MKRRHFMTLTGVAAMETRAVASQTLHPSKPFRWSPDGVASIGRIGVLTPDNDPVPESEMAIMAPQGVSIHASRVTWNHEALSFAEHAGDAVEVLARVTPRVILYAFTSSSYVVGAKADDDLRVRLQERAGGTQLILTCMAALEALGTLGVHRVALIHPPWFSEDVNRRGMEYFRARGFEVVFCERITPARAFTEVSPAEVYDWVRTNLPRSAEAVFIGGNGLRAIGVIHALEESLHRPVLTANQVILWEALRVLRTASKPTLYGRLFTTSGPTR